VFAASHPEAVARSLGGLPGLEPRARALREQLAPQVPAAVLASTSGLDDECAWQLRERLYEAHPTTGVASLAGLASERAWELRARWRTGHGFAAEVDYERARAAARSVHGLDDERAWALRKLARAAAPIASLGSIGSSNDARAWRWRERLLRRAPKTVMETLRDLSDARAYQLREAVAADTKEAIDSIRGLGDDAAWRMRERYVAVWPSTVVKSLGPLADTPRGRDLITTALADHAGNVSLLKHAAAIALGLHRSAELEGFSE